MAHSTINILITGSEGQLGQEFKYLQSQFDKWKFHFFDRKLLDITSLDSIQKNTGVINPDVIINCAAYTNVELAESESDQAFLVNTIGAENLAHYCKENGILLIHFSTDYVFDGTKNSAYNELDFTNPLSVYGKSKLAGEQKIREVNSKYFIFRISWLYGTFGKNFYKTMLRLAKEKTEIKVVDDQIASPTYSRVLAFDILTFLSKIRDGIIAPSYGIYNYTNGGEASWHSFATEILRPQNIIPIAVSAKQFPTKAIRPAHSKLDTTRWERSTGIPITAWKTALERCLADDSLHIGSATS